MKNALLPVDACTPVAGYIGGKRNLAGRIVSILDRTPHRLYAEPFVGMGGVFFRRTRRPVAEAINDRSKEVSNLFRIVQRHYPQFIDMIRFQIAARADFECLVEARPETLTDLERAARFLVLQRLVFGGKVVSQNFGVAKDRPARLNVLTLEPLLAELHERLSTVTIECLDWSEFVTRYDDRQALFYLDPPYWGSERDYGPGLFAREDFARMATLLGGLKGRFILSLNDLPPVRDLFARFHLAEASTTYGLSRAENRSKPRAELLISNFDLGPIDQSGGR